MTTFDYDQRYIQAALEELETYLHSDKVFWPVNAAAPAGESGYPKLTAANLLLALDRLENSADSPTQQAAARKLSDRFRSITGHWQSAWQSKLEQEYTSRLRQWGNYLQELDTEPHKAAVYYATEVRLRLLLALLAAESSAELPSLANFDAVLKKYFENGDFVWDDVEQGAFPQQPHWYLYGQIKTGN